ncbi:DUF4867 family protein [Caproiciproducens sp. R2]|uniref:DUF4867 family protein n=1 Tax=Caproiciproducens sp. R2 TaxID=3435187 RepID=UPI004033E6A3
MELKSVTDPAFQAYGRVVEELDFSELIKALQTTPCPAGDVVYVPSDPGLEALDIYGSLRDQVFGEMPIQLGYCNGNNHLLNALEYHRSSEVNVAATDMVLILGRLQDVTPQLTYDTAELELFRVPKGKAVELYGTTLHYAPCNADSAVFRVAVVLPRGTNTALAAKHTGGGMDRLITAKNKWLIAHPDSGLPKEVWKGLLGENISVRADRLWRKA